MHRGRMLIVVDDPDDSAFLRIYFQSEGYEVAVAQRGEQALEMCQHQLPDIVFVDVMLPDMDGYDICRELRGNLRTSHIPIVFLTQKDKRSDKIHGLELGADDYITKPFDPEELRLRAKNIVARNRFYHAHSRPTVEQSHVTGRRMMIVEDDPDISGMLDIYFQSQGYEVEVAQRGEDALEMIRQQLPHIIVLDIMLPDMDGYDVCRGVRGTGWTSYTPIIFLTQKDARIDKIHGLELGADDYITKPFDLGELELRIKNAVTRAEGVTNTITGLPSGPLVEEWLAHLFFYQNWAVLYVGIKNFAVFKELYGPAASDEVLCSTATALVKSVHSVRTYGDFIGHIDDDDFIIITSKDQVRPVIEDLQHLDKEMKYHYDWQTREQGYMIVRNEAGNETKAGLMSLAIGMVTAEDGPFTDIREIIYVLKSGRAE